MTDDQIRKGRVGTLFLGTAFALNPRGFARELEEVLNRPEPEAETEDPKRVARVARVKAAAEERRQQRNARRLRRSVSECK